MCNARHMQTPLVGTAEACRMLGKDKATLSRWVASGRLTPVARTSDKPNGAFLFDRAEIERVAAEVAA